MNGLEKALWIINKLSTSPSPLPLNILAQEIKMTPSGVYKILSTLSEHHFVFQEPYTKHYRLGMALLRCGYAFTNQLGILPAAEPILNMLVELSEATVSIGILEGLIPFMAYQRKGKAYPFFNVKQGVRYPLHASALGKCLGAFCDQKKIRTEIYRQPLEKFTERTIIDPDLLLKEYEQIIKQGYASSIEEHFHAAVGVAVPIKHSNYDKTPLCLNVGGFLPEFNEAKIDQILPILRGSAEKIAENI